MKLDFSEFHPLDHWPGSARCRSMPGGTRNHLQMTWEFRRRDQVLAPLYKFLLCRLGRHAEVVWYRTTRAGDTQVQPCCKHCNWTRLPSEADLDNRPEFLR